jgi:transcriptional regulator with XRE-family HTH domain
MNINDILTEKDMTRYRLSKISGVPFTTIGDICNGKTDIEKCSAGTLYKIAKVLGVTIEELLESSKTEYRSAFETFKSNTCHQVKDMGDVDFMIHILESDEIRTLYNKGWYPEALYLLAMLDYLSRVNDVPLCTRYNDIRSRRLSNLVFPVGVVLASKVIHSDEPLKKAEAEAIPEFRRFNIIESEVRNVV